MIEINFGSEYLNKKIQKPSKEDFQSLEEQVIILSNTFNAYKFKSKDKLESKINDLLINFEYETSADLWKVAFDSEEEYVEYFKEDSSVVEFLRGFRRLNNFEIKNSKSIFNIQEDLPKDFDIFFSTSYMRFDSFMNTLKKRLVLNTPPLSKLGILTLTHEAGHQNAASKVGTEKMLEKSFSRAMFFENLSTGKSATEKDGEILLRDERDAWSYTLKKMRPFLKSLDISQNEIDLIIKNFSLRGYENKIKEVLSLNKQ